MALFCWLLTSYGHKDRNFSPYSGRFCPYAGNADEPFEPNFAVYSPRNPPLEEATQNRREKTRLFCHVQPPFLNVRCGVIPPPLCLSDRCEIKKLRVWNKANGDYFPTVFWSTHPKTSEYLVSSRMSLLLLKNMEDLSGYLQYVFNVCIDQRNYVDDLVRKSLSETKPKPKSVVGFTFNDENAEDAKSEETTGTDERNDGDMAVAAKAGTTL